MTSFNKIIPLHEGITIIKPNFTDRISKEAKAIIEKISNIFSKEKKIETPIDRSFTDTKLIKEKKLSRETKEIEKKFQEILNFAKSIGILSKEEIIDNIKKYRGECGRNADKLDNSINTLRHEQIEYKTSQSKDAKDTFLKSEFIKESEDAKNKLEKLENLFQTIWMQQRAQFKPKFINTVDDLYGLLNQDICYTTKSKNQQKNAKIIKVSKDIKNKEIVVDIEMELKDKLKTIKFPVGFKYSKGNDAVLEINKHFGIKGQESNLLPIDGESLFKSISQIINENVKIIDMQEYNTNSTRKISNI